MKTKVALAFSLALLLSLLSKPAFSQTNLIEYGGEYPLGRNDANNPCITPAQYVAIQQQNATNIQLLGLQDGNQNHVMTTAFSWPLRMANGLSDCSYYGIFNYVDQDPTAGILDWHCGSV